MALHERWARQEARGLLDADAAAEVAASAELELRLLFEMTLGGRKLKDTAKKAFKDIFDLTIGHYLKTLKKEHNGHDPRKDWWGELDFRLWSHARTAAVAHRIDPATSDDDLPAKMWKAACDYFPWYSDWYCRTYLPPLDDDRRPRYIDFIGEVCTDFNRDLSKWLEPAIDIFDEELGEPPGAAEDRSNVDVVRAAYASWIIVEGLRGEPLYALRRLIDEDRDFAAELRQKARELIANSQLRDPAGQ